MLDCGRFSVLPNILAGTFWFWCKSTHPTDMLNAREVKMLASVDDQRACSPRMMKMRCRGFIVKLNRAREVVVYIFGGLVPVWQADLGPSVRTPDCTMHCVCIGRRVRWPAVVLCSLQGILKGLPGPVSSGSGHEEGGDHA